MDVDFEFTVTRLAKIANTNNLSAYRELRSATRSRLIILPAGKPNAPPDRRTALQSLVVSVKDRYFL
jgi:hypothetical protein